MSSQEPSSRLRVVVAGDALSATGLSVTLREHPRLDVVAVWSAEAARLRGVVTDVVVLVDTFDPLAVRDCLAVIGEAGASGPAVLVVLHGPDPERALDLIDAGAAGVAVLDATTAELVNAVEAVANGGMPIDARLTRHVIDRVTDTNRRAASLTGREQDVLARVWRGLSNKQIARELGISEPTVKVHLTRIYQRLGVTSRTEAAMWEDTRRSVAVPGLAS